MRECCLSQGVWNKSGREPLLACGLRQTAEYSAGRAITGVRASNTQAILVLRCEADSQQHLDEIEQTIRTAISQLQK